MEEKNELNDIILNKSGSGSNSKKLLLAIAALTLLLIIVLVVMNSLKSESDEQPPHTATPTVPSAPTEIIDDPLFEPVEVIQEGGNESASQDLGQIAQKIKQESLQATPVQENVIEPAPVPLQPSAAVIQPKPAQQKIPVAAVKPIAAQSVQQAPISKSVTVPVNTPTIKTTKSAEVKKPIVAKKAPEVPKIVEKAAVAKSVVKSIPKETEKPVEKAPVKSTEASSGTYYIQVGSFSKQPSQALFDRLNASGLKYSTVPSGTATKVIIGPFQGEKAARDVLGTVKRNIESGAYVTKG